MSQTGFYPYDLAGNWCEECGRPKMSRLFDILTGCKTCDEAITRHRCTKLPAVTDRAPGQEWDCPDCGGIWRLAEEEEWCLDCCGECGHKIVSRRWVLAEEGDRIDSAPKRQPSGGWTPLRNALRQSVNALYAKPQPPSLPKECHRTASGIMVHVKPGCRC